MNNRDDKIDAFLKIFGLGLSIVGLLIGSVRQDRAIDKAVKKKLEEDREEGYVMVVKDRDDNK